MCMTLYTVESGIEMAFSKQEDLGIKITSMWPCAVLNGDICF